MRRSIKNRYSQRGFTLVGAIFLIVILGMLGTYMVSISGVSRTTTTFALQGAQAYQAAYSGIQWGVFQAINNFGGGACARPPAAIPNTAMQINGYTVNVTCSHTRHNEYPDCARVFVITSEATGGSWASSSFVSRELETVIAVRGLPTNC